MNVLCTQNYAHHSIHGTGLRHRVQTLVDIHAEKTDVHAHKICSSCGQQSLKSDDVPDVAMSILFACQGISHPVHTSMEACWDSFIFQWAKL